MGRETIGEVWDGLWDLWRCSGRFVRPSGKTGTDRETLGEVQTGQGPSARYRTNCGTSGRSGMGRGNLGEVRDGSWDPQGGPGRVVGPSGRSGMGWGTLG